MFNGARTIHNTLPSQSSRERSDAKVAFSALAQTSLDPLLALRHAKIKQPSKGNKAKGTTWHKTRQMKRQGCLLKARDADAHNASCTTQHGVGPPWLGPLSADQIAHQTR